MKRFLAVFAGFLVCTPVLAQLPVKQAAKAVKIMERGTKNVSTGLAAGGLRAAAGMRVPSVSAAAGQLPAAAVSVDRVALQKNILEQSIRQSGLKSPAEWIRRAVERGDQNKELLRTIFAVTDKPARTALLQNEFLTLTLERKVPVSPEQAAQAIKTYRLDLGQKQDFLTDLTDIPSPAAFSQADPKQLLQAGQVLADLAGIGFYGNTQDAPLILTTYRSASKTVLEPVIFTAAARALLQLQAYDWLELLFQQAGWTEASAGLADFILQKEIPVQLPQAVAVSGKTDWTPLEKALSLSCRLNVHQLDFSAQATQDWLRRSVHFTASAPVQETAAQPAAPVNPIPVFIPPEKESLQVADISAELTTPGQQAVSNKATYGFFTRSAIPSSGVVYSGLPVLDWIGRVKKWFSSSKKTDPDFVSVADGSYNPVVPVLTHAPRTGLMSRQYPSGLEDEDGIIRDWLEYFKNGYFHPRDQVEAIEGMSAAKANNVMEYLYYMSLEEAEKVILNPIRQTGRLPDFMYDDRLISGTKRLPAGYYKNKFNANVKRFIELAEEDGSIYTHNVELKDLAASMADYSFKQGFRYTNDPQMTAGLRHNWKELVGEIRKRGLRADRALINDLWRRPVALSDGKTISLKEYFTQTRTTAFFKEGRMPEFFLNSDKWVALENERRNLAAVEFINQNTRPRSSWVDHVQNWLFLGKESDYLTLEQFGEVMASQYKKSFGAAVRTSEQEYTKGISPALLEDATPSSMTVKINNFDKVGGVCQMSFSDGGYMGRVREGYDGTSTVNRFDLVRFFNVPVVTFDFPSLKPRVLKLKSVPYLKDLKEPNLDQVRAGTMVGDGLDPTRDLLGVRQAEAALPKVPHLKATLYPRARLKGYEQDKPEYLDGGGLAGYLTLFTPDFYPIKKIYRLRFKGWKPYFKVQYYIRKEVPALAGLIHRDRLTFTEQVADRIVSDTADNSSSLGSEQ